MKYVAPSSFYFVLLKYNGLFTVSKHGKYNKYGQCKTCYSFCRGWGGGCVSKVGSNILFTCLLEAVN